MDIHNVMDTRVQVLLNYVSEEDVAMSVRDFLELVVDRIRNDLRTDDTTINDFLEDRI